MPIRPLDIMKSQEVSHYKQYESNRVQQQQAQLGKNFQNSIQKELRKPNEAMKSDHKDFRYDAKEKGNNQYFGSGNNKKQKKEDKKESKPTERHGGIDILI